MKRFILMLQFLTRIPININLEVEEKDFFQGIIYFPLVGLLIGMFVVVSYYLGVRISGKLLGAVLAVVAEVFITGGLHLDGLADTFDGIYSNRPKERILEIMKDSRLGTNGALALFILLLLKAVLISDLPFPQVYPILLLMPAFSRLNVVFASRLGEPARKQGMGNLFIGRVNTKQFIAALFITTAASLIYPLAIPVILMLIIFTFWYVKHVSYKIDGITGDILGALCELSELVFLVFLTVIYAFM